MVAMGTSLSDKAWGKESAVFRITGVISVIGGWFFTAFSAFSVAFIVALLFTFAGFYAIFGLLALVLFLVIRSHIFHKKRIDEHETKAKMEEDIKESNIVEKCTVNITDTLNNVSSIIDKIFLGLEKEDRKILKEANKDVNALNKQAKYLKDNVYKTITKLDKDSIKTGHFYVQVLDYLRETAHALTFISQPSLDHVDNNFGELLDVQIKELELVSEKIKTFYKEIIDIITSKEYDKVPIMIELQQRFIDEVNAYRVTQIKRVKHKEAGTKNSVLYLGILHEVKNLFLNGVNLLKAQRDFDNFKKI
jgi:Na+/phosphate symporter